MTCSNNFTHNFEKLVAANWIYYASYYSRIQTLHLKNSPLLWLAHAFSGICLQQDSALTNGNIHHTERQRYDVFYWTQRPQCNAATSHAIFWESGATLSWKNTNSLALTIATAFALSTYTHKPWLSTVHSWHGTLGFVKKHSGKYRKSLCWLK